jgi:hypothetical protein
VPFFNIEKMPHNHQGLPSGEMKKILVSELLISSKVLMCWESVATTDTYDNDKFNVIDVYSKFGPINQYQIVSFNGRPVRVLAKDSDGKVLAEPG